MKCGFSYEVIVFLYLILLMFFKDIVGRVTIEIFYRYFFCVFICERLIRI